MAQRRDIAQPAREGEASASELAGIVAENIDALIATKRDFEKSRSFQECAGDRITTFAGSMWFVYLHIAWFAAWILWNLGWLGLAPFDEFPFGLLTMVVSLEAIFLATFVLLSQNRSGVLDRRRADLDLQINLLAEHEVTRMMRLTEAIAARLGVAEPVNLELEQDISPTAVLQELERRETEEAATSADAGPESQESALEQPGHGTPPESVRPGRR